MDKLTNKKLTDELINVFDYIKNNILIEFPSNRITPEHFLLSVLNNEESIAYKTIDKIMFNEAINTLKSWYYQYLSGNSSPVDINNDTVSYDGRLSYAIKKGSIITNDYINSGDVLYGLIESDEIVKKSFRLLGVTEEQIKDNITSFSSSKQDSIQEIKTEKNEITTFHEQKQPNENLKHNNTKSFTLQKSKSKSAFNEVEKNLTNLNTLASEGKIDEVFENDDIIYEIFTNLQKRYKNNVILVGESGCGKTSTIKHIANMLINGEVPKPFLKKKLMKLDFMQLISGTNYRGTFESKFNNIINDAKKDGNYIFFIDDIQSILGDKTKFGEVDVETMLDAMLMEKNIQFICTSNHKAYKSYIENNASLKRRFQKVVMDTPSIEKSITILNKMKHKIELFHNVKYDDNIIETCVKLCKRYITDNVLPDSAINIIDKIGAKIALNAKDDERIIEVKNKINLNNIEKERINSLAYKDYDKYDELVKKEIQLKTQLSLLEKDQNLNRQPYHILEEELRDVISTTSGIPVQNLAIDDMSKLRNINENIKKIVIGQDVAVDTVCNAIKKQKLGISNPDKPPVFLFTGSTGTGKTLLAKKIAKEVYGDEKYLVRLDMSEYSEKTSVTKLCGSAPGYIGYDNGGILTEAIKNKKYCVLLLDEIEKANEEVHNMFLQLFDEGRMTDNTGYVVDFKNVIIIMTSNIGAKELEDKGDGIGFNKSFLNNNEDIIKKAIKKKFKPEFINRVNKIVYFNKLSYDNIHDIIKLELLNLEKRLNSASYYLEEGFIDDELINKIHRNIEDNKYGAREIIRQIEINVEDVITDYILNNNILKEYTFTKKELFNH